MVLPIGSLSNEVFEQHMSTRSGPFPILGRDFDEIFKHIVSMREKTLKNTNLVASRHIKGQMNQNFDLFYLVQF